MEDSISLKRCSHCKQMKPATGEHFSHAKTKDGWHNLCKQCNNELARERSTQHQLPSDDATKTCPKCGESKPATLKYFPSHKRALDHLYYICKECKNAAARKPPKYIVPEGYKRCPQCGECKPATFDYFSRRKNGLYPWCKLCANQKNKEQKPRTDPTIAHIRCTKCHVEYPFTSEYFHKHPYGMNGLRTICKFCVGENGKKYRTQNKDIVLQRTRMWRRANYEYCLAYSRRYYADHKEHYSKRWEHYYKTHKESERIRKRAYHFSHRDQILEKMRERRKTHRYHYVSKNKYSQEYYRKHREYYIAKAHRRRNLLLAIPGTLTTQQIEYKLRKQRFCCYYCFAKFKREKGKYIYHLDHTIPISRAEAQPHHDMSHIVLTCPHCNLTKSSKRPHEWPKGNRLL